VRRLASYDHRIAAVASTIACFNPNNTIFTESSPRFKQVFMYMVSMDTEEEFDEMAQGMTIKGYAEKIKGPVLLAAGEFDPLCPLDDAIEVYQDMTCKKEMWVFENQFHLMAVLTNLGGLDHHQYIIDWLHRVVMDGKVNDNRIAYVKENGEGPFAD
jgi:cephalosporin-C deacetylase-like acetyl esterase